MKTLLDGLKVLAIFWGKILAALGVIYVVVITKSYVEFGLVLVGLNVLLAPYYWKTWKAREWAKWQAHLADVKNYPKECITKIEQTRSLG